METCGIAMGYEACHVKFLWVMQDIFVEWQWRNYEIGESSVNEMGNLAAQHFDYLNANIN